MKLVLSEEQQFLKDTAKNFAAERTPVNHFRSLRDNADPVLWDKDIWQEMVALGWSGILIPEDFGGSNFGLAAAMGSGKDLVSIAKKHVGEENGKISNSFYRSEIATHKIKEHAFGLTLKRAGDEGGKASATASMFKLYGTEHNKKRHELLENDHFSKEEKELQLFVCIKRQRIPLK